MADFHAALLFSSASTNCRGPKPHPCGNPRRVRVSTRAGRYQRPSPGPGAGAEGCRYDREGSDNGRDSGGRVWRIRLFRSGGVPRGRHGRHQGGHRAARAARAMAERTTMARRRRGDGKAEERRRSGRPIIGAESQLGERLELSFSRPSCAIPLLQFVSSAAVSSRSARRHCPVSSPSAAHFAAISRLSSAI